MNENACPEMMNGHFVHEKSASNVFGLETICRPVVKPPEGGSTRIRRPIFYLSHLPVTPERCASTGTTFGGRKKISGFRSFIGIAVLLSTPVKIRRKHVWTVCRGKRWGCTFRAIFICLKIGEFCSSLTKLILVGLILKEFY